MLYQSNLLKSHPLNLWFTASSIRKNVFPDFSKLFDLGDPDKKQGRIAF